MSTTLTSSDTTNHALPASKVLAIGFALFAMFFGAGNLVFPLALGAHAGQYLGYAVAGFLIFGVGAPFLGLFATALYHGDYMTFFNRIGRIPGIVFVTFLILIIGPLSAMPRTEVITYQTFKPFLPSSYDSHVWFSAIYCGLMFLMSYREAKIIDILGKYLSPIKLLTFFTLVVVGLMMVHNPATTSDYAKHVLTQAIVTGYGTMDLIASFFFCSIAYRAVQRYLGTEASEQQLMSTTLKACIVGGVCLGLVYIGFMLLAAAHAGDLQHIGTDKIIGVISHLVFGRLGAAIVCICILFACFSTAMGLAEVSSRYLYMQVFKQRVNKTVCLTFVTITTFIMTNLGFDGIMAFAIPILLVVYPSLVVLSIVNILHKLFNFKYVKFPVYLTMLISLVYSYHSF
ncbi:MAG: branched-chain amino acid transport system II carrier protein [Gammaproteobacteria bacterium]